MRACKHCGGEVAQDGYAVKMADGGLVELDPGEAFDGDGDEVRAPESRQGLNTEEGWELEQRQANEGMVTEQQSGTELLRDGAFATAHRRAKMAEGGMVGATEKRQPKLADLYTAKESRPSLGAASTDRSLSVEDLEEMEEKKRERYGFKRKAE